MRAEASIDAFLAHLAVERGLAAATVEAYARDLAALLVSAGFGYRTVFWATGALAFVISPIADNLTTALLMCAVVLAVGGTNKRFVGIACINIVVAANAGGAFSPFGDITTLMVWQKGILGLLFYKFPGLSDDRLKILGLLLCSLDEGELFSKPWKIWVEFVRPFVRCNGLLHSSLSKEGPGQHTVRWARVWGQRHGLSDGFEGCIRMPRLEVGLPDNEVGLGNLWIFLQDLLGSLNGRLILAASHIKLCQPQLQGG